MLAEWRNTERITQGSEARGRTGEPEGSEGESGSQVTSTSTWPEITGYLVFRLLRDFNSRLKTLKQFCLHSEFKSLVRHYFGILGVKGLLRSTLAYPRNSSELALSLSYMLTSTQ